MTLSLPIDASGPPAMRGGTPPFDTLVPLAWPDVPSADELDGAVARILESRVLTNGPFVRQLEQRVEERLGVRHCIAVASCTAGLTLVLRASELTGDVVLPSFTFTATAHAVAWNGLTPVFADVSPDTLTLDPSAVRRAVGVRCSAIVATHTFGTPCDVEGLAQVADELGVRLVYDAAHALGSHRDGVPIGGFGDAEVFSLSPTKMVVAGEGGLITTDDDELAERCRIGRDYGNPGDYDCRFVGLNARMSEFHAAVAIASLEGLDARVARRNALAERYRLTLADVPGLTMPSVADRDGSTYKDLTVLVDARRFGMDATTLATWLAADNVETRRYYAPPVHHQQAYRPRNGDRWRTSLPVTEQVADEVLTLPLWSTMSEAQVEGVVAALRRIQRHVDPAAGAEPVTLPAGPSEERAS